MGKKNNNLAAVSLLFIVDQANSRGDLLLEPGSERSSWVTVANGGEAKTLPLPSLGLWLGPIIKFT